MLRRVILSSVAFLLVVSAATAQDATDMPFDVRSGALNVVLTATDADATRAFYGESLGLKEISQLMIPDAGPMLRFMGGKSELKFIIIDKPLPKTDGGETAARGIRSISIFVNDREGVISRLKKNGFDVSAFVDLKGDPRSSGLTLDPDGNVVDIVFMPDTIDMHEYGKLRINLTVGNRDATRKFYKSILGLSEFSASAVGDVQTYMFQAGLTSIRLLHEAPSAPVRTDQHTDSFGYHYIQFLVPDVEAVKAKLEKKGANIVRGPFALGNLATIMFVADPDGTICEFAGPQKRS